MNWCHGTRNRWERQRDNGCWHRNIRKLSGCGSKGSHRSGERYCATTWTLSASSNVGERLWQGWAPSSKATTSSPRMGLHTGISLFLAAGCLTQRVKSHCPTSCSIQQLFMDPPLSKWVNWQLACHHLHNKWHPSKAMPVSQTSNARAWTRRVLRKMRNPNWNSIGLYPPQLDDPGTGFCLCWQKFFFEPCCIWCQQCKWMCEKQAQGQSACVGCGMGKVKCYWSKTDGLPLKKKQPIHQPAKHSAWKIMPESEDQDKPEKRVKAKCKISLQFEYCQLHTDLCNISHTGWDSQVQMWA